MTPASLLPLACACASLLSTSQLLLSPDVEDEECGANDWLRLSSGHWMPKLGLGTAGLTDPDAELIFVTNITNYISGEKIVMWRNFGKFWKIIEKFWEILRDFTRFHVEKN